MPILKNPRHERFAQLLASGKSATDAYAEAGYKPNRHNAAYLASANQGVKARVAELQARAAEGVVLSRQWVIERLIENANRAMQAEALKDSAGNLTGEYRYEGSVANRALELLGKEIGMFRDRAPGDSPDNPLHTETRVADPGNVGEIVRRFQSASLAKPNTGNGAVRH